MKKLRRRKDMAIYLMGQTEPIPGHLLGKKYNVSRQVIVGDISALREMGYGIASKHNGYVITKEPLKKRVFKVRHDSQSTKQELEAIVNLDGIILDVFVQHKVYGKMSAPLNIYNKEHVDEFVVGVTQGKSSELMNITDGYHYHTVAAESEEILDKIQAKLIEMNMYIAKE